MDDQYFQTRLNPAHRRGADRIWGVIASDVLRRIPGSKNSILDLGAGYGDFINQAQASDKWATDQWQDFPKHLAPGVQSQVGDITQPLSKIPKNHFDLCFLSNVMEHFTVEDGSKILENLRAYLKPSGHVAFLQPNFTHCSKSYFDDYTHKTIYTAEGFKNFLEDRGFQVVNCIPKYLPFSFKSRLPRPLWLIKLYMKLPFKPLAAQMLVIVKRT